MSEKECIINELQQLKANQRKLRLSDNYESWQELAYMIVVTDLSKRLAVLNWRAEQEIKHSCHYIE